MTEEYSNRRNFEITLSQSDALDWAVTCEHLTIELDALSVDEALRVLLLTVRLLEAMYP